MNGMVLSSLIICFFHVALLLCSESRFVGYESLNFTLRNADNEKLTSAPNGTERAIYVWDDVLIDNDNVKRNFDVNKLHKVLQRNISGGKNKVSAAFTIIYRRKDTFFAINKMLTKPTAKAEAAKKQYDDYPAAFVSSGKCNLSELYNNLSELYRNALKRNRNNAFAEKDTAKEIFELVKEIQALKYDTANQYLKSAISEPEKELAELLRTNIENPQHDVKDVLSIEGSLNKQLKDFTEHIVAPLGGFNENLKKNDNTEDSALNSKLNELRTRSPNLHLNLDDNKQCELRKERGYGPVADSEQRLLHYLENKFFPREKPAEGLYVKLRKFYKENQFTYLRLHFSINYEKLDEAEATYQQGIELAKAVKETIPLKEICCIIHIFSTHEPCQFCAASLFHELYKEDDNFVTRLKKSTNLTPFVFFLISYGEPLSQKHDDPYPLRPQGITQSVFYRSSDETFIDLDDISKNKILPLMELKKDKTASNEWTIVDEKIIPISYQDV